MHGATERRTCGGRRQHHVRETCTSWVPALLLPLSNQQSAAGRSTDRRGDDDDEPQAPIELPARLTGVSREKRTFFFYLLREDLGGVWTVMFTFFRSASCFLAKRFQLHALSSSKLQFFVELLHSGVCGLEFVEQSQIPLGRSRMSSALCSVAAYLYIYMDGRLRADYPVQMLGLETGAARVRATGP